MDADNLFLVRKELARRDALRLEPGRALVLPSSASSGGTLATVCAEAQAAALSLPVGGGGWKTTSVSRSADEARLTSLLSHEDSPFAEDSPLTGVLRPFSKRELSLLLHRDTAEEELPPPSPPPPPPCEWFCRGCLPRRPLLPPPSPSC